MYKIKPLMKECPKCHGLGIEHGCIGEGLCLLCLGRGKVLINRKKRGLNYVRNKTIRMESCRTQLSR